MVSMKIPLELLAFAAALICAACADVQVIPVAGTDVFGVELGQRADHGILRGEVAQKEPCLHGYEYVFDSLAVRIGYDSRGTVRAITTRNPSNSVVGLKVGEHREEAVKKLKGAGFAQGAEGDLFVNPPLAVKLLVSGDGLVFGMRLEKMD